MSPCPPVYILHLQPLWQRLHVGAQPGLVQQVRVQPMHHNGLVAASLVAALGVLQVGLTPGAVPRLDATLQALRSEQAV